LVLAEQAKNLKMQNTLSKRLFLSLTAFAIANFTICQAEGQAVVHHKDYSQVITQLDSLIKEKMARYNIKAVSIALVDDQSVILEKGFGFTDKAALHPVNEKTLFSAQSISKTYTSTAFLMECTEGKYNLDDPLIKYYPSFSVHSRSGPHEAKIITFRHLLSHRAGFCQEAPIGSNYDTVDCTFEEHIKSISRGWLRFPVGKFYSYSNAGLDLTGYILSKQADISIDRYMKQTLLIPLGMTNSTYDQEEAYRYENIAKGHYGNSELRKTLIPDVAAGGLYSSVEDMAKFVSFQLNNCKIAGKVAVAPELLSQMRVIQFRLPQQPAGYGLGISIKPYQGGTLLYHVGGGYGYSAIQAWIPEFKIGIVILTNSAYGYSFNQEILNDALQGLIKTKTGSLTPTIQPNIKPVITLKSKYSKRFIGTYKTNRKLVTIKAIAGSLALISGTDTSLLRANSATAFTAANGERLIFHLKKDRVPAYFISINQNDADFFIFNDAPGEKPGANKVSWKAMTGTYQGYNDRQPESVTLSMKNGYLYCSAGGETKVSEYKPGLFFTADGESLFIKNETLYLGNRAYSRQ